MLNELLAIRREAISEEELHANRAREIGERIASPYCFNHCPGQVVLMMLDERRYHLAGCAMCHELAQRCTHNLKEIDHE